MMMNRLHKKINISLKQKLYFIFIIFIIFGWYKNALLPFTHQFYSLSHVFLVILFPISSFLIGALFDYIFKNHYLFDNKFYGLLFSLFIPISTNICLYILLLTILLFLNTFWISKKESDFNFLVFGKLILVLILYLLHSYDYANALENSHLFIYSYLDSLFGHTTSGLFSSSTLLIIISFVILNFDTYYKKEIPFYSYGVYLLTLVIYSFFKSDMTIVLKEMLDSSILFALIFIAPLSSFSPYSKKRIFFYSILLGLLILPFSLMFNFYEGVYIALFFVNILLIILNYLQIRQVKKKIS